MTLSQFETWLILGVISVLVFTVGYFIRRDVLERKNKEDDPEPYRPKGDFEKSFWRMLMEKIDNLTENVTELTKDVTEIKTYIGVQTEKNTNVHEKISEINTRLNSHGERLTELEKKHERNHGR